MSSPEEVVLSFCRLIGDKNLAAIELLIGDKVVYHNIGTEPSVGREATLAAIKFQFDMFDSIEFRVINLAVDGENVLTERVDEVTVNGIIAPVPVMGTFVVRNGCIVVWRDYFDMGLTKKLMSGEDASAILPRF